MENRIEKYYRISKCLLEIVSVMLFVCVIFFQSLNIFFRYTNIAGSIIWVEELTRYSFIWIAFLLWPLADRGDAHFRVDIFPNKLNEKKKLYFDIFIDVLALCFAIIVIWASFKYIPVTMLYRTDSISWLKMGMVYLVIPIGLTLLFVERILMIFKKIKKVSENSD
ncbi:TRAP transporter small permease subunit [Halocella sp. SP3-1]|uniref:TRAP transporter small permease n=1 Tax=Halocella sp. SP3-1 TaxID=2382161 RepID=UPI000F7594CC|nr:TRAP transporter small permease subunit [Halocella sp. SP3-1]AZO95904.1 TRAP transporter small permease [Halocella sp. SP3-1]MTI61585.1 TRAP transporter small permease [Bacillota bacterium]